MVPLRPNGIISIAYGFGDASEEGFGSAAMLKMGPEFPPSILESGEVFGVLRFRNDPQTIGSFGT